MVLEEKKVEFCPACGKGEIRRDLLSFDPYCCDTGGRNEVCSVCQQLLWVPMDEKEPIFIVPLSTEIPFEFEDIDKEKEFFERLLKEYGEESGA